MATVQMMTGPQQRGGAAAHAATTRQSGADLAARWAAEHAAGGMVFELPSWLLDRFSYGHKNVRRALAAAKLPGATVTTCGVSSVRVERLRAALTVGVRCELVRLQAPLSVAGHHLVALADPRSAHVRLSGWLDPQLDVPHGDVDLETLDLRRCAITGQRNGAGTAYVMLTDDGELKACSRQGLLMLDEDLGAELAGAARRLEGLVGALLDWEAQAPSLAPRSEQLLALDDLLAVAADLVLEHGGWTTRRQAGAGSSSGELLRQRLDALRAGHVPAPSARAVELAAELAGDLDPGGHGEYRRTICDAASSGWVAGDQAATVASALAKAHERVAERLAVLTGAKNLSVHVGQLGERITVEARVERAVVLGRSHYGVRYGNVLRDMDGNLLLWRTGRALTEGEWYAMTGKVAAHSEFRGEPQTELQNCRERAIEEE